MLQLLACPRCSDAFEREMLSYQEPQACDDCGIPNFIPAAVGPPG